MPDNLSEAQIKDKLSNSFFEIDNLKNLLKGISFFSSAEKKSKLLKMPYQFSKVI